MYVTVAVGRFVGIEKQNVLPDCLLYRVAKQNLCSAAPVRYVAGHVHGNDRLMEPFWPRLGKYGLGFTLVFFVIERVQRIFQCNKRLGALFVILREC